MQHLQRSIPQPFRRIAELINKQVVFLLATFILAIIPATTYAVAPVLTLNNYTTYEPSNPVINVPFGYTSYITNTGGNTIGTTTIKSTLGAGLTFVSATPQAGSGFTCSALLQVVTCTRTTAITSTEYPAIDIMVKSATVGTFTTSNSVSGGGAASYTAPNVVATVGTTAPDIVVSVGQPSPTLAVTAMSEIPVTVTNIGNADAPARDGNQFRFSVILQLPTGIISSPVKYLRNADSVYCISPNTGSLVCFYGAPLAIGASNTFKIPINPSATTAGTTPAPFIASITPLPVELNTANNSSAPMTPTSPVTNLNLGSIANASYATRLLDYTILPKYALPLPNLTQHPYTSMFSNDALYPGWTAYDLDIKKANAQILGPGFPGTNVFAYGNTADTSGWSYNYPANTIVARSTDPALNLSGLGKYVAVQYNNTLPGVTQHLLPIDTSLDGANMGEPPLRNVAHLHGNKFVNDIFDGYPEAWKSNTGLTTTRVSPVLYNSGTFSYYNWQESSMLWYHDHTIGLTRLNVYAGLAGAYIIRDDNEMAKIAANQLPSGPYEIPLILQDRMFKPDGSLAYPSKLPACTPTPTLPCPPAVTAVPEFYGKVMTVNGVAWPFLSVEPRKYRFRVLNGSNSRFYTLTFNNETTNVASSFQVIGGDGGLLNAPVTVSSLTIAPAERYDIIVDFAGKTGQQLLLKNSANSPYGNTIPGGFATPVMNVDDRLMRFQVDLPMSTTPNAVIPASLRAANVPAQTPTAGVPVRRVLVSETVDSFGRILPSLGTVTGGILNWMAPVTETPLAGTVERWEIFNDTADAHPIHLHGGHFQVVNRQAFTATQVTVPGVKKMALSNIAFPTAAVNALPQEKGFKDTVIAMPGQVTRINMKFETTGNFLWHCHILEHEDHEMMRPLQIQ